MPTMLFRFLILRARVRDGNDCALEIVLDSVVLSVPSKSNPLLSCVKLSPVPTLSSAISSSSSSEGGDDHASMKTPMNVALQP